MAKLKRVDKVGGGIMNTAARISFALVLLICLRNAHAMDAAITERAVESYLRCEYNRTFGSINEISVIGSLELDSGYAYGRAGLSYGRIAGGADIKMFADAGIVPFSSAPPLEFSVSWIYNGLPGYEAHSHTILPAVSYNARRAGMSVGSSLRFTSFFGDSIIFESVLAFSGYFNFINSEALRIGVRCGNFSDFYAGSMGAYSLELVSSVRVRRNWLVISELGLMQSGGDGLSTVFYGFVWRGGARFSW